MAELQISGLHLGVFGAPVIVVCEPAFYAVRFFSAVRAETSCNVEMYAAGVPASRFEILFCLLPGESGIKFGAEKSDP